MLWGQERLVGCTRMIIDEIANELREAGELEV